MSNSKTFSLKIPGSGSRPAFRDGEYGGLGYQRRRDSRSRPRINRPCILGILLLAALSGTSATALAAPRQAENTSESVLQVIEAYVTALGGRESLARLTSRKADGVLEMSNRGGDRQKFTTYWRAPDFSCVRVDTSETLVETGFDGKAGWRSEYRGMSETLKGRGLQLVLRDANPLRYARLAELFPGVSIDADPPEDAGKRTVLVFRSLEETIRFYFDPRTHLLAEITSEHISDETGIHRYLFEDYRAADGVLFPFVIREIVPIPNADPRAVHIEHVLKFRKVEHNVSVPDSVFSPPT